MLPYACCVFLLLELLYALAQFLASFSGHTWPGNEATQFCDALMRPMQLGKSTCIRMQMHSDIICWNPVLLTFMDIRKIVFHLQTSMSALEEAVHRENTEIVTMLIKAKSKANDRSVEFGCI